MNSRETGISVMLCGLPGCGKTEAGRMLAQELGIEFIDLDDEIEKSAGQGIAAIFASGGELLFREMETTVLLKIIGERRRGVLSLGGGTLEDDTSREAIESSGIPLVWLRVAPVNSVARLEQNGLVDNHPLLKGLRGKKLYNFIVELDEIRRGNYARADYAIDVDILDVRDTALHIREWLGSR